MNIPLFGSIPGINHHSTICFSWNFAKNSRFQNPSSKSPTKNTQNSLRLPPNKRTHTKKTPLPIIQLHPTRAVGNYMGNRRKKRTSPIQLCQCFLFHQKKKTPLCTKECFRCHRPGFQGVRLSQKKIGSNGHESPGVFWSKSRGGSVFIYVDMHSNYITHYAKLRSSRRISRWKKFTRKKQG